MSKDLKISLLLDFYGQMLTDKQREVVELYYNEDLSLAEIAQHSGITRQGVRDSIKRGEGVLLELEERLGLSERFRVIQQGLDEIVSEAYAIGDLNNKHCFSNEITVRVKRIREVAEQLYE